MPLPRRLSACLLLPLAVLCWLARPAAAHPFGPPSTARITADKTKVTVTWMAAEDDWVALGQSLGAFEDPATGTVSTELTGEQKLQRSGAVRDYLLSHITVSQGGTPCAGRLEPLERLLALGARFTYECPAPVSDVDVRVAALTDLHDAYRTVLITETATPRRSLLTAAKPTQRLRFAATAATDPSSGTLTLAVAIAAVLSAALVLLRRHRGAPGLARQRIVRVPGPFTRKRTR